MGASSLSWYLRMPYGKGNIRYGLTEEKVKDETRTLDIVNLTGRPLRFHEKGMRVSSQGKARIEPRYEVIETVTLTKDGERLADIDLLRVYESDVFSLPEPEDGKLYVVTGLVETSVRRSDIFMPARVHKQGGVVQYARALLQHEPRSG